VTVAAQERWNMYGCYYDNLGVREAEYIRVTLDPGSDTVGFAVSSAHTSLLPAWRVVDSCAQHNLHNLAAWLQLDELAVFPVKCKGFRLRS
jgi:hypothetical protein